MSCAALRALLPRWVGLIYASAARHRTKQKKKKTRSSSTATPADKCSRPSVQTVDSRETRNLADWPTDRGHRAPINRLAATTYLSNRKIWLSTRSPAQKRRPGRTRHVARPHLGGWSWTHQKQEQKSLKNTGRLLPLKKKNASATGIL